MNIIGKRHQGPISSSTLTSMFCALLLLTNIPGIDSGVLTDKDILYRDIFTNYSAKTPPVLNHTDQTQISFIAYLVNINNFEEKSGELSVTISFHIQWIEERISWDPVNYANITSISVSPEDLWRPQLFLLEASDYVKDVANTSVKPRIMNTGRILWNAGNALKVSCSVDVTYFPFDKQTCVVTFFNWDTDIEDTLYYPNETAVSLAYFKTNSQWSLDSGILANCSGIPSSCINLILVLKRQPDFYVIYIISPLIFLSLINNLVFLMPASSGERTSVAVTTFLSFVVYMDIVNGLVPQSSNPMAYVYFYILTLMIYSCVIMFLCIISLRIYDRKTPVSKKLQTLIWYFRLNFLFITTAKVDHKPDLSIKRQESLFDTNDDEKHDHALKTPSPDVMDYCTKEEICWYIVGKTFDIYCLLILYLALTIFTIQTFTMIADGES